MLNLGGLLVFWAAVPRSAGARVARCSDSEAASHLGRCSLCVMFTDIPAQHVREALSLPVFADTAHGPASFGLSATVLQSPLAAPPSHHVPPPRRQLSAPQGLKASCLAINHTHLVIS